MGAAGRRRATATGGGRPRLEEGALGLVNVWNGAESRVEDVIAITYATSRVPEDALRAPLEAAGLSVECIGDARAPRGVLAATREGYEVAMAL